MFSNHTTPEELKTQQSAVILDSVGGTLGQRNHMIVMYLIVFEKLRFRFSWIGVDGRNNRRNKAAL